MDARNWFKESAKTLRQSGSVNILGAVQETWSTMFQQVVWTPRFASSREGSDETHMEFANMHSQNVAT